MASYNEWKEHFKNKNKAYLRKQLKLIQMIEKIDNKIKQEFQLNYLPGVGYAIKEVLGDK